MKKGGSGHSSQLEDPVCELRDIGALRQDQTTEQKGFQSCF